jgi:peptidoglycan/xylan/chitin deacetylase (PgdA/CDA1 family)
MPFAKNIAKTVLHDLGAIQGVRLLNKSGIRILMYHRFPPGKTAGLNQQCELIRRHYNPVSLQAIAEYLRDGKQLPRSPVAITIDDGYRDFLEAQAIFRQFDIPATVFLVSDFLDGKLWLWFDKLKYALRQTKQNGLTIDLPARASFTLPLNSDLDRQAAREKIANLMKGLENSQRISSCEQIVNQLEVELPASPPDEFAPLTWEEVRSLARERVEFGPHTKTHPILSQIVEPELLADEILGSKKRIEEELKTPAVHFCYPNGRKSDLNDSTLKLVQDGGFHSAVTTERGMNNAQTNPFLLRRLGVEPTIPLQYFAELLAGVRKE